MQKYAKTCKNLIVHANWSVIWLLQSAVFSNVLCLTRPCCCHVGAQCSEPGTEKGSWGAAYVAWRYDAADVWWSYDAPDVWWDDASADVPPTSVSGGGRWHLHVRRWAWAGVVVYCPAQGCRHSFVAGVVCCNSSGRAARGWCPAPPASTRCLNFPLSDVCQATST